MTDEEAIRDYVAKPYSRILVPDSAGRYFAEILEFPGCFSEGDTPGQAMDNLNEAMAAWIEAALESGQAIPEPISVAGYSGRILLRLPKSLHKAAARRAELEGVSLNHYLVTSIAAHLEGDDLADRIANRLSRVLCITQVTQVQIADTTGGRRPTIHPPISGELQEADSRAYQPLTTFQRRERQHA